MKKALVWVLLGSMVLTSFVGCGKKDGGATITDVQELSDEEMAKIMEEYFAQQEAAAEGEATEVETEAEVEAPVEEADQFAIPEVIEGKVPTKNDVYLAFEDAGLGKDKYKIELNLNDSDEYKKVFQYSEEGWQPAYDIYVVYRTFESAEFGKSKMDLWTTDEYTGVGDEPDVSEEMHYCVEPLSHEMKNSCEVKTFKRTLHDNRCNVINADDRPTYLIEEYVLKGEGLLQFTYSVDEAGEILLPQAKQAFQIFKDLEFITYE